MNAESPVEALRGSQQQSAAEPSQLVTLLKSPKVAEGLKRVSGKLLDPQRLIRLALFSVKSTPKLALCTPASVLGSLMIAASFGLEPNTPSQQCFLIPRRKARKVQGKWTETYNCTFQFGYRGMVTLAYRSGVTTRLKAEAIRENDDIDYAEGSDFFLKYKKALRDRGELTGAFCYTDLKSGHGLASVLPGDFIEKIRGKSEAYRALSDELRDARNDKERAKAEAAFADQPWIQWDDQMWAKTAIKFHTGQLPMFDIGHTVLAAASSLDDASDAGIIDMDDFVQVDAAIAAANGEINVSGEDGRETATQDEERGAAQIGRETQVDNMPPIDLGLERSPAPAKVKEAHQEPVKEEHRPAAKEAPPPAKAEAPTAPQAESASLFGPAE